jgi:hypothetical protein
MAVSVDTVYQRVLAILSKEQRGYVTPQEFNLFANQAMLDIFEQYFYDINQFSRLPGNDTEFSDMLNMLNEKINIFEKTDVMTFATPYWTAPADLYRIGTIFSTSTVTDRFGVASEVITEAERINFNEFLYINQSRYTKPVDSRPVFVASDAGYKVYGNTILTSGVSCNYIKIPSDVSWNYQMVFGEALYDSTNSVDFELHESEETELVIKILAFAGLAVQDIGIYQVANQIENQTNQQEKQ